jgi:hypothetical protein
MTNRRGSSVRIDMISLAFQPQAGAWAAISRAGRTRRGRTESLVQSSPMRLANGLAGTESLCRTDAALPSEGKGHKFGRANQINDLHKSFLSRARGRLTTNSPMERASWRVIGGDLVTLLP